MKQNSHEQVPANNAADQKLQQKIHTRSAHLDWRKPAKVSGKLIQEIIQSLKTFPRVMSAYITEVQVKDSADGYIPVIAISAPHIPENDFEKILNSVCQAIERNHEITTPFDICRTEHVPEFESIKEKGLARQFYQGT